MTRRETAMLRASFKLMSIAIALPGVLAAIGAPLNGLDRVLILLCGFYASRRLWHDASRVR